MRRIFLQQKPWPGPMLAIPANPASLHSRRKVKRVQRRLALLGGTSQRPSFYEMACFVAGLRSLELKWVIQACAHPGLIYGKAKLSILSQCERTNELFTRLPGAPHFWPRLTLVQNMHLHCRGSAWDILSTSACG